MIENVEKQKPSLAELLCSNSLKILKTKKCSFVIFVRYKIANGKFVVQRLQKSTVSSLEFSASLNRSTLLKTVFVFLNFQPKYFYLRNKRNSYTFCMNLG